MTGVLLSSAATTMTWAARVPMGTMALYPSATIWDPIWVRVLWSFWPLNT